MATVVAGILVLTIILGMFGVDVKTLFVDKGNVSKNRGLIIFAIAGIITLVIFLVSASHYLGFSLLFGGISVDQDLLFTFFVLIVMGAVVYLIVKDGNKGGE
ncbi:MAG: hypothetical protein KAJ47_04325, partial [Candidatus Aenigmarchaeota archaeon]|nr:hypothetical protein [Candidatus Aenigmarchaeota archaeon]